MSDITDQVLTVREMVEHILEVEPDTRDSDVRLMIAVWKKYYPEKIHIGLNGRVMVWVADLYHLPREDRIKRVRALVQNVDKKFPPTTWEVAEFRGWAEDEWKLAMGYHVENPDQLRLGV